jgi:ABC-2 type transport system permease protein
MMESRIKRARGVRYSYDQLDIILPSLSPETRAWFNPNLESKDFFIPGILALILTFFSLISTAMVLVREKETGTIEQLMVTPISRLELVVGKTIPSFIIALVNLIALTVLALVWFQPPFKGSMLFFSFCGVLYLITCLSLGITISAFCRTQQQAILSSFMVLQPAVLLSGFVFPIENMPVVIQYITYIDPLRYFIVIVREVFLKGIGWEILWPQVLPIAAMGIGFIGLSALLFKKKID